MDIRIIKRKNNMYDLYDRVNGKWLVSYSSPDNVFAWLSEQKVVNIDFVDEVLEGENAKILYLQ